MNDNVNYKAVTISTDPSGAVIIGHGEKRYTLSQANSPYKEGEVYFSKVRLPAEVLRVISAGAEKRYPPYSFLISDTETVPVTLSSDILDRVLLKMVQSRVVGTFSIEGGSIVLSKELQNGVFSNLEQQAIAEAQKQ